MAPQDSAACTSLGQTIQRLRQRERLSCRELADAAKIDHGVLRRIEAGNESPSFDDLVVISNGLLLPLTVLIGHFENEHYLFEDEQPGS